MKAAVRVVISVLALVVAGAVTAPAASGLSPATPNVAAVQAAPDAGAVVSVTPARVADSRDGLQIPGAVAGFGTVGVQVAGRGGIPGSGAAAVVATVTVTGPQGGGYLTVWPSGVGMPGTSNLNFQAGQTVANMVIVRLGTDGWIQLFNGSFGTVQVIVDVTGYTRDGSTSVPGAMEVPDNPQRLADSRIDLQLHGPVPALGTVAVQAVPGPVGDVVLTVTVVDPQAAGYITVWRGYSTRPETSNLNFQAGRTVATTVIVPVSGNGVVELFNGSSGSVQLIVDINGFTLAGTPTAAGAIGSVTARIADSRLGLQIPGAVPAFGSVAVQVASPDSGVAGAVATVTVVDPQAGGYVTAFRSGARRPGTSNLNFQAGQTVATTVIVPVGPDGKIELFNGSPGGVQLVVDITGSTLTGVAVHGAVWAWGAGDNGQLGNGSTTGSPAPVPVFGLGGVTAVAGGGFAGYALRGDGTVWSWGTGAFGQWGTGGCCAIVSPVPLRIPGLSHVTAVAGGSGTGYALRSDGTVWSWGDGRSGALGDGDDESYSTVPVQVAGLEDLHITAIAAGFATGYALTSDGFVWAWGAGGVGQLGNNGTTNSLAVRVSNLSNVTAIAAAGSTGYALRADRTVQAWGTGTRGELGDGAAVNSLIPVAVSGLSDISAIAAGCWGDGGGAGYALRDNETVSAWGWGLYGQLGNGATDTSLIPVAVSGLTAIAAIAATGATGYALGADRTVRAWGRGAWGQLGNGSTDFSTVPVPVFGLTNVTAIAAGSENGYAITD